VQRNEKASYLQSQRLAENVLNRASIQLSNRIQSFFLLCNGFSNCLNGNLLPFVFNSLFLSAVDLQKEGRKEVFNRSV